MKGRIDDSRFGGDITVALLEAQMGGKLGEGEIHEHVSYWDLGK